MREFFQRPGMLQGLVLSLLCVAPAALMAQIETLRVGVYENPPKVFVDDDGRPSGFWPDLTRLIAEREGWAIEWTFGSWSELLGALEANELDVMVDVAVTDERRQQFAFGTETVHVSWSQVFAAPDSGIATFPHLQGRRIGALEGSVNVLGQDGLQVMLDQFVVTADVVPMSDYESVFRALAAGEIDAAVTNREFGGRLVERFDAAPTPIIFQPADLRYAFPIDSAATPALIDAFDARMRELRRDSDSPYHALQAAWFGSGQDSNASGLPVWLNWVIAGLLATSTLLAGGMALVESRVRARTRELRAHEQELERHQEILAQSQRMAHVGSWQFGIRDHGLNWSDETYRILGLSPRDHTPSLTDFLQRVHPEDRGTLEQSRTPALYGERPHQVSFRIVRPDGEIRYVQEWGEAARDDVGRVCYLRGTIQDITERKLAELELQRLAYQDPLTRLPSRNGFSRELERRLGDKGWQGLHIVAVMDVRGMRDINDAHGYGVGDKLLVAMAERLRGWAGELGLAARTGGDEFILFLCMASGDQVDAELLALREYLCQPYTIDGVQLHIRLRIGFTAMNDTPRPVESLVREAELALFHNRTDAAASWAAYSRQLDDEAREQADLLRELRVALEAEQFEIVFQPKVALDTGRMLSCEALLRWNHPLRGIQSPAVFIPLAEKSQLIEPIGDWVLRAICRHIRGWHDAGLPVVPVAMNVSLAQFRSGDLPDVVQAILTEYGLPAESLAFEVTESVFEHESDSLLMQLRALHDMGVWLSLDDFGTGYSSLLYLQSYPFDEIKIDQGFVRHMRDDVYSHEIVATVLRLGSAFDAQTVAEGIETADIRDALLELGCTTGQGYYFSVPLAAAEFQLLLQNDRALPLVELTGLNPARL